MAQLHQFRVVFAFVLVLIQEGLAKGVPTFRQAQKHQEDDRIPLLNIRYEFVFPQMKVLMPLIEKQSKQVNDTIDMQDGGFMNDTHVVSDWHTDPIADNKDYMPNDEIAESAEEYNETRDYEDEDDSVRKKRHARMKCGGRIADVAGLIQTPDYPYNYENNIECTWNIITPEDTTVWFFCEDFDLQGGNGCQNDYLEISSTGDTSFYDSTRYCDNEKPLVNSTQNRLTLRFVSNNFYRYRGFSCRFVAIASNGTALASAFQAAVSTNDQLFSGCNSKSQTGNEWNGRCGVPNNPTLKTSNTRMVGAANVAPNEYPWTVAMLKRCGDTKYGTRQYCLICGGTVVAPEWIMTAAHCIAKRNISEMGVLLGDQNLFKVDTTQKFSLIAEVYIHPEFNRPTPMNHDLALVRLTMPVKFSRFISPICLPKPTLPATRFIPDHRVRRQAGSTTSPLPPTTTPLSTTVTTQPMATNTPTLITETMPTGSPTSQSPSRNISSDWSLIGKTVKVLGWGVVDDTGNIADKLRAVDITVIDNNDCDYYYGIMTDTMMCTSGEGGEGPCGGDSGGPAMIEQPDGTFVQVGILAFGAMAGCEVGYPSGQVLVSRYLDWIEYITKGEVFK